MICKVKISIYMRRYIKCNVLSWWCHMMVPCIIFFFEIKHPWKYSFLAKYCPTQFLFPALFTFYKRSVISNNHLIKIFYVGRPWKSKLLDRFEIYHLCPKISLVWKIQAQENLLDCALWQKDFRRMLFQLESNNFQNKYLQ